MVFSVPRGVILPDGGDPCFQYWVGGVQVKKVLSVVLMVLLAFTLLPEGFGG
jgi:hypothetical protein